jgi:3-hydroxyacyl-CoA dehydrogenase
MNAIGGDTIEMLQAGVKEAASRFRALVVGTDAPNFSAGANRCWSCSRRRKATGTSWT